MANDPAYTLIADTIQSGLKNVEKYYEKTSNSDVYFICLVLDPNFKLAYVETCWTDEKVVSRRACFEAVFDRYHKAPPLPCTTEQAGVPPKVPVLQAVQYGQSWMHDAVMAHQATEHCMHDPCHELTLYLSLPLEETDDVVAWWGLHSLQYPTLTHIAHNYLLIQGSAVPSERAFSSGRITSTLCHNALASSTFSALQLMKATYHNGHLS
ncbi:ribonuclease H-like domain-containing protein, partial [Suillus subaureus]